MRDKMHSDFSFDGFDTLDLREPEEVQRPAEMLVPGLIPKGEPGMLVGDPGLGKSEVGLTISVALALGLPAFGLPITIPKTVVYVAFEGSQKALRRRVSRISHNLCPDFGDDENELLNANLHLLTPSPNRPVVGPEKYEVFLQNFERLSDQGFGPGLLIIDTLSYLIDGDENQAASARGPWRMAQGLSNGFGWTVLMIHHMRKALQNTGPSVSRRSVSDIRGTSAHGASARFILELSSKKWPSSPTPDGDRLDLRLLKYNDGPEGFTLHLVRDSQTGILSRLEDDVVHTGKAPFDGVRPGTKSGRVLEILRDSKLPEGVARERALQVFKGSMNPEGNLRSCTRHLRAKGLLP